MKFAFIAAENAQKQFEVTFMCRELGVSRSGFYASRARGLSDRAREDLELVPLIKEEFDKHKRGCGTRMVRGGLRQRDRKVGRNRIRRLMREEKLRHRLKRRFVVTTQSKRDELFADNVLNRAFEVGDPDKVWAGDITYIHTLRGWIYLAVILDLGSRKVVGWHVAPTLEEDLVLRALDQALAQREPPPGLLHHSDRGTQYTARSYQKRLADHGIVCSMSRRANCWDNSCVESFFSTLKRELPNDHAFRDHREVETAVFEYIDAFYNTRRPHSALDYRTPNAYEKQRRAA